MGKGRVDPRDRWFVQRRARGRCEYCGYPELICAASFHCDHFVPRSKGGKSNIANLVWGCPNCNSTKHSRIAARDPITRRIVPLFNPRHQRWYDHFRWSADGLVIQGTTATGRATVFALKMNRQGTGLIRSLLKEIGLHPPRRS
jgi:hypothetical protein